MAGEHSSPNTGGRAETADPRQVIANAASDYREAQGVIIEDLCPGCGRDLKAKGRRSWCVNCGYCQKSEVIAKELEAAVRAAQSTERRLPPLWVMLLVVGCAGIVSATVFRNELVPRGSSMLVWWIAVQGGGGVASYLLGHALLLALTFSHWKEGEFFLDPLTVWKYAFSFLPRTGWSICLASWGATAFLCAFVLFWQNNFAFKDRAYKKAGPTVEAGSVKAKEEAHPADNAPAEEVQPTAAHEDLDTPRDVNVIDLLGADRAEKERRQTVSECVVIGYVTDPKNPGSIAQLVLGTRGEDGSVTYAGTVSDFAKVPEVDKWLAQVKGQRPLLDTPAYLPGGLNAVPIDPSLTCKVGYAERNAQGVMKDTVVKGVASARPGN